MTGLCSTKISRCMFRFRNRAFSISKPRVALSVSSNVRRPMNKVVHLHRVCVRYGDRQVASPHIDECIPYYTMCHGSSRCMVVCMRGWSIFFQPSDVIEVLAECDPLTPSVALPSFDEHFSTHATAGVPTTSLTLFVKEALH